MDLIKKYKGLDGSEHNIAWMVQNEQDWAANRIQVGERALAMLTDEQRRDSKSGVANDSATPNTDYSKCAEKIMRNISGRRGYDIYSCGEDIVEDIQNSIVDIIAAHFA